MHDYLEAGQDFAARFVGQPDSFLVAFSPAERDTALFDVGVRVTTAGQATLAFQYFAFASSAGQDHGGSLAVVVPY